MDTQVEEMAPGPQARRLDPISVTVDEAKRISGLGTTTLYALLSDGKLKSVTVGRRRLIDFASLKALLAPPQVA